MRETFNHFSNTKPNSVETYTVLQLLGRLMRENLVAENNNSLDFEYVGHIDKSKSFREK